MEALNTFLEELLKGGSPETISIKELVQEKLAGCEKKD